MVLGWAVLCCAVLYCTVLSCLYSIVCPALPVRSKVYPALPARSIPSSYAMQRCSSGAYQVILVVDDRLAPARPAARGIGPDAAERGLRIQTGGRLDRQ
jgi:hypothetical protein